MDDLRERKSSQNTTMVESKRLNKSDPKIERRRLK
jgi:hypothetical protein